MATHPVPVQRTTLAEVVHRSSTCPKCHGTGLIDWQDEHGAWEVDRCPDCPHISEDVVKAILDNEDQWVTVVDADGPCPVISFDESDIPF